MVLKKNIELRKIIREILLKEYNFPFIFEGIDIDNQNKTVSFNPSHENNVNTSIKFNPVYGNLNGIETISIFQRKDNDNKTDGNPLVYALKGIKGWKFLNPKEDIIALLKQFIRIAEKIKLEYDTIITIPSTNPLNIHFLHRLNKIIKAEVKIKDYLTKLSADDVWEDYIDFKQMSLDYGDKYKVVEKDMLKYFKDMEYKNNNIFSFKYISNIKLRKYIKKTMFTEYVDSEIKFAPFINGKNVLILDDTISTGASISEMCNNILETYVPNSITVITLFSKI